MLITWLGEFVADNLQNQNFFQEDIGRTSQLNDDNWLTE